MFRIEKWRHDYLGNLESLDQQVSSLVRSDSKKGYSVASHDTLMYLPLFVVAGKVRH